MPPTRHRISRSPGSRHACIPESFSTRAVAMSARTCASVNRSRRSCRNARPASPMRGSPRPPSPAAIETVRLPRHSGTSPEGTVLAGLKIGRFVHASRFIFADDLLIRPAPPNVAPISWRASTGSLHAEPSGRSKNTGAPRSLSLEWMRVARARVERAPALQSLLLGLSITVLDEHAQERERVEMRALSRTQLALGQFRDGLIDLAPAPSLVGVIPFNDDQTARLPVGMLRGTSVWRVAPRPTSGWPGSRGSRS